MQCITLRREARTFLNKDYAIANSSGITAVEKETDELCILSL